MRIWCASLLVALSACSDPGRGGDTDLGGKPPADMAVPADLFMQVSDDLKVCQTPPTPAGPEVVIAPAFATDYKAYLLGPVPGVSNPLGGVVVKKGDPNTLLVVGESESINGAIYAIGVNRDQCGHILTWNGTASKYADAPYADANLVYGPNDLIVYTEWPRYTISQLAAGATSPSRRTDLLPLGIAGSPDEGPGGIGFVPMGLASSGQLRIVTWPEGRFYHVGVTLSGGLYTIDSLSQAVVVPNNPGGFAYVPAGSPQFSAQSLIVAEWNQLDRDQDRVAVYEVNQMGDPTVSTRREFMTKFPRPWGAYFEPLTGDYLFLTWGDGNDRVYLVQGFAPPSPIF
jgi:hypothetical protein